MESGWEKKFFLILFKFPIHDSHNFIFEWKCFKSNFKQHFLE